MVRRGKKAVSSIFLGLVIGLCGFSIGVQPQKVLAAHPLSAHVSMVVSVEGAEGSQKFEIEIQTKGNKSRLDLFFPVPELGRAKMKGVVIVTPEEGYLYFPQVNMATKLPPMTDLLAEDLDLPFDLSEHTMAISEDILVLLKEGRFTPDLLAWMKEELELSDKEVGKLRRDGLSDENILALMEKALGEGERVRVLGQEEVSSKECTLFEIMSADGSKTMVWLAQGEKERYPWRMEAVDDSGATVMTMEITQIDLEAKIPDSEFELPPNVVIARGETLAGLKRGMLGKG